MIFKTSNKYLLIFLILLILTYPAKYLFAEVFFNLNILNPKHKINFKILMLSNYECNLVKLDSNGIFKINEKKYNKCKYIWVIDNSNKYNVTLFRKNSLESKCVKRNNNLYVKLEPTKVVKKPISVPSNELDYKLHIIWDKSKIKWNKFVKSYNPKYDEVMFSSIPVIFKNKFTFEKKNSIVVDVGYKDIAEKIKSEIYLYIKRKGFLPEIIAAKEVKFKNKNKVFEIENDIYQKKLGAYISTKIRDEIPFDKNVILRNLVLKDYKEPYDFKTKISIKHRKNEINFIYTNQDSIVLEKKLVENSIVNWQNYSFDNSGSLLYADSISIFFNQFEEVPCNFSLFNPVPGDTIKTTKVNFCWENKGDPDPPNYSVKSYSLQILYNSKPRFTIKNIPATKSDTVCYQLNFEKEYIRKSGMYFWRVLAYDSMGNMTVSNNNCGFFVPKPLFRIIQIANHSYFKIESVFIKNKISHIDKSINKKTFLDNIYGARISIPKLNIKNNRFLVGGELSIFYPSGYGLTLIPQYSLFSNRHFNFSNKIRISRFELTEGIKMRTNSAWSVSIGTDLLCFGKNIPIFQMQSFLIPYKEIAFLNTSDETSYFHGSGYALSFLLAIPNKIINKFKVPIINVEIDLMRIPFKFGYSFINGSKNSKIITYYFGFKYLL